MQWLYRVIGQAGIFLICAQTVVHFRPKESYDKYLKLLLSVMLLLQLLQPVLSMFGGGDGWNAEEQVTGFMQELQTVLTRASEQAEQSQEEIGNTAAAVALEAGEDGLVFYKAIAEHYQKALRPGGALALEIGWQQREAVTALLEANGWADIACRKDFGGNDRCVTARRPK